MANSPRPNSSSLGPTRIPNRKTVRAQVKYSLNYLAPVVQCVYSEDHLVVTTASTSS